MSISSVLSSPDLGVTVNVNRIVISNHTYDILDAPLANALVGSVVIVQLVDFSHYRFEEPWMSAEKIVILSFRCAILRKVMSRKWLCRSARFIFITVMG